MRIALVAAAVLLVGCGGAHHTSAARCTLTEAETPTPETGEHFLAVRSSCAFTAIPAVVIRGLHGRRLGFTYLPEGGRRGAHTVLLDKYRCDVRWRDLGHTIAVGGARLGIGRSLMDWCPAEGVSTVVQVYLGGLRRRPGTWRTVLRDVYDGHLDRLWPCRPLRDAIRHLPSSPPAYSTVPETLARAAASACDAAIAGIAVGAPRFAVEQSLGSPDSGGQRCPVWRWKSETSSVDGARICFSHARASLVQTALHG